MVKSYETVIIFTPVLSDQEVKKAIGGYVDFLKEGGAKIVHENFWGLRQLAYPIQKKTTGIYYVVEYQCEGELISNLEVQFRRDSQIMRFLTILLEKYAIEYNDKKRRGLIGRKKTEEAKTEETAEETTVNKPTAEASPAAPVAVEAAPEAVVEEAAPEVVAEEATTEVAAEEPATENQEEVSNEE